MTQALEIEAQESPNLSVETLAVACLLALRCWKEGLEFSESAETLYRELLAMTEKRIEL